MKKLTKLDKVLAELDEAYRQLSEEMDRHELHAYIDRDGDIKGRMVEESDDIEAHSVAILGAYTVVSKIREEAREIAGVKEAKKE